MRFMVRLLSRNFLFDFENGEDCTPVVPSVHEAYYGPLKKAREYAVMLAVILVIVVGTIRLVGSNANKVFSSVANSVQ
jgi:hypothetical protein